jgi:hypothetical protein
MPENSAAYWLQRAEEARVIAEGMTDDQAKTGMLRVAARFEKRAAQVEAETCALEKLQKERSPPKADT